MLDTGNFVLADSDSVNLWESFNNPRDTILPSQTLKPNTVLFSRFLDTNYSRGRFKPSFWNEGDLRLNPLAWPTELEYASYLSIENSSNNCKPVLVLNESSSDIYLMDTNEESLKKTLPWKYQNIAPSIAASYYRATLDHTGVFTVYLYSRGTTLSDQRWSIVQYIPQDICSAISDHLGIVRI
ncbi:hypothetical protein M5689_007680 [Euphorbia peplus]|nr:hypothetical protein M5689_007680 [Euphorbia peplus]